jgi:predicted house-cleaning noncanonical NTP pyrophosphatase (MazG superfamily)
LTNKNKLVRDKIPSIIENFGKKVQIHTASEQEYLSGLKDKLTEEVHEFFDSEEIEELVDILEVVYALSEYNGFTIEELEKLREQKAQEKGRFTKRIILENTN